MAVDGIHLSWIIVSDLEKAIEYYTNVIGLTLMEKHPQFGWAELSGPNGSRFGVAVAQDDNGLTAGVNAIVTISIDSVEEFKKEKKDSVEFLGEPQVIPGHVILQMCRDSDGNHFQVVQKLD